MRLAKNLTSPFSSAIVATLLALSAAAAKDGWCPAEIDAGSPPFNTEHQHVLQQYVPLSHATRAWRRCASIPHIKDDYWLAANFGLVDEAKRLGGCAATRLTGCILYD